jgi:L,D-peptidoglycan transpeptidase YkuD (ErfK/YbiS/YcfS/YnhG family)
MKIRTALLFALMLHPLAAADPVIPADCRQLIVVIADSIPASNGKLARYQRDSAAHEWQQTGETVPAGIGSNGLAWGIGRHSIPSGAILKQEGDQCSPAGVFELPSLFGFAGESALMELHMPYRQITDGVVCIDDTCSAYYNTVVSNRKVKSVDWNSNEDMAKYDPWYRLGVIIGHNSLPSVKGAGSCIFLHIRADNVETTYGCTAIAEDKLVEIFYWLDKKMHPLLVQLSLEDYNTFRSGWKLP